MIPAFLFACGVLCFVMGTRAPATFFNTARIERASDRASAVRIARRLTLAAGAAFMLFAVFLLLGHR